MATPLEDQINLLASNLGVARGIFDDILTGLVQVNNANNAATNSTLKNINARTVENDLLQKRNEREQALINLFQNLGGSFTRTINGLGSLTAQLYASSSAFDSAKISLDAFGNVFQAITKIIQSSMSVFSFLRGAGDAFKAIADSGIDLAINALKNRIEQARIITETFQTVGKAGATFGGSLSGLIEAAGKSTINLQEFGKFVASNLPNLTGLGQTVSQSSVSITNLSKRVAETDSALLVLKGSYSELATATAEYMALQKQIGITENASSNQTRDSVRNYIRLQNELSEITGRSVAEQRRAEEQRRQVAAYQMAASKLEGEQRNNLMAVMTLFDQMGPDMASAMQEFFANNGQMVNAQNITFATMNKDIFDMGVSMLQTIRQPTEQFKASMATTAQSFVPAIRAQQASMDQSGMLMLAGSRVGGDVVGMLGRTTAAIIPFLDNLEKLPSIINKLSQEAAESRGGLTPTLASAIENQNRMKIELDKIAVGNLAALPDILSATEKIATGLVKAEADMAKFTTALIRGDGSVLGALNEFKDGLRNTIQNLFGVGGSSSGQTTGGQTTGVRGNIAMGIPELEGLDQPQRDERLAILQSRIETLSATLSREQQTAARSDISEEARRVFTENITNFNSRIAAMQAEMARIRQVSGRQEGGIATEPTIVGENNQPEAVIPLARGNIPLNINFGPMLAIMEQQREYLEEILRSTDNNSDYLERIYHATA